MELIIPSSICGYHVTQILDIYMVWEAVGEQLLCECHIGNFVDQDTVAVKNEPGITMGTLTWNLISLKIIILIDLVNTSV